MLPGPHEELVGRPGEDFWRFWEDRRKGTLGSKRFLVSTRATCVEGTHPQSLSQGCHLAHIGGYGNVEERRLRHQVSGESVPTKGHFEGRILGMVCEQCGGEPHRLRTGGLQPVLPLALAAS